MIKLLPITLSLLLCGATYAQTRSEQNPVEKIMELSNGDVIIEIPDNILENILNDKPQIKKTQPKETHLKRGLNKLQGYRIQVFSDGRNHNSLEQRAKARGTAIVAKFPKYRGQVYSYSSSPNWYTRIGNFRTTGEANAALSELKRAFPSFAKEMRVVKSQIVVIR